MDDIRTPMEAEVQELAPAQERCADDSYGTAVRPRPQRSHVGLWIGFGLAVITVCTFCVAAAVSQLRLENGIDGLRIAVRSSEETQETEAPIRSLTVPDDEAQVSTDSAGEDVRLPLAETADEALTPAEIYAKVSPAVVCVTTESYYGSTSCTGVVVASDGYILTASDDLYNTVSISVSFSDGTVCSARRLGEDQISGVCLLKAEAEGLQTVRFSETTDCAVGQTVYTVSNPYGDQIPNVFSDGMLSVSQSLEIYGVSYALLQSTAGQEGAGYGCPLLDDRGLVIGITTPIGKRVVSGTDPCFALASADLGRIVAAFENRTSGSSVWLGLEVEDIPEGYQNLYRYPGSVWISEIAPGSALVGNLYQYDIILAVDGIEITDAAQFDRIISSYEPNDRVVLTFYRYGNLYEIRLPVRAR